MTSQEGAAYLIAGVAGVLLAAWQRDNIAAMVGGDTLQEDQTANGLQSLGALLDPTSWGFEDVAQTQAQANRRAMLETIAYAEGTQKEGGYYALFGWPAKGRSFFSTLDHPRRMFPYTDKAGNTIQTSAAGRYQITKTTFDDVAPRIGVRDFTPASQDAIALELIRQRGALPDVDAGRFADAISKIRRVWASLPGAGYNQPERDINTLALAYQRAGGNFA